MVLEGMDFQALSHQMVTQLMESWLLAEFGETEIQECGSQMFNMGMIACQQMQQEGAVQAQGSDQPVPYTEAMVKRTLFLFLSGLNSAVLKAHEQRLPSQEKWQFLQNCAYHVFEQSKQAMIATLGQEDTPEVQIPDDQILGWLNQTAVEALIYYINEHEKQHGPITRTDAVTLPDVTAPPESATEPVALEEGMGQGMAAPIPQPAPSQAVPDIHHKYAAVALLLNSLSRKKQASILAAFKPDEQRLIFQYQDPDNITRHLDLGRVSHFLKQFKEKLGQPKAPVKSTYASTMGTLVSKLPAKRLNTLFQQERPMVRGYIQQFTQPHTSRQNPYTLPAGVEESLMLYIERNFPHEVGLR